MFSERDQNISAALDWCVDALDTLNAMPPDVAAFCGIDLVLGWKAALERAMTEQTADEHVA